MIKQIIIILGFLAHLAAYAQDVEFSDFHFSSNLKAELFANAQLNDKLPDLEKLRLDSTKNWYSSLPNQSLLVNKSIRIYDKKGRVKEIIRFNYLDNKIDQKRKTTYSFNQDSTIQIRTQERFNFDSNEWEKKFREIKKKPNGSIEIRINQYLDEEQQTNTEGWINSSKYETQLNEASEIIKFSYYTWSVSEMNNTYPEGEWLLESESISTFDTSGRRLLDSAYRRTNEGRLIPVEVTRYAYSDSSMTSIQADYNEYQDAWYDLVKHVEIQNETENKETEIIYDNENLFTENTNTKWLGRSKTEYFYDQNSDFRLIKYYQLIADYFWFNYYYTEYYINDLGQRNSRSYKKEYGDREFQEVIRNYKNETQYDPLTNTLTSIDYTLNEGNWVIQSKNEQYFSPIAEYEVTPMFNASILYPNPSSDFVSLDLGNTNSYVSFIIIDLKGNELKSLYVNPSAQIDISDLPNGTYFYLATYEEEVTSGRFIKN